MRLKETLITLVGFFKCSIENNILLCDGILNSVKDDTGETVADMFVAHVFDPITGTIPSGILIVFNQVGDKIVFLYRKEKFEVKSISDDLIRLERDGIEYTLERTKPPF